MKNDMEANYIILSPDPKVYIIHYEFLLVDEFDQKEWLWNEVIFESDTDLEYNNYLNTLYDLRREGYVRAITLIQRTNQNWLI